jgi:beta-lactamase class A
MLATLLFLAASVNVRGHIGALAMVPGQTGAAVQIGADEHFPMQSVYKFPIGMAVLHEVDQGKLKLDQPVTIRKSELAPASLHSPIRDEHPGGDFTVPLRDVLRYAVSESDGTASDVLLRVIGGPQKVQAYLSTLGVTEIRVVNTEMEMARDDKAQYRNWATPRAAVQLLQAFYEGRGLSQGSRQLLLELMTKTGTGPNRIRGMLPVGTPVAHKTGTSGTVGGVTAATNDIGLVTLPNGKTLAIAIFISDSPENTAAREAAIAQIAREAWDKALAQ